MLIKLDFVQKKSVKRILEHCLYLVIVLILIPSFLYFEVFVVLPTIEEVWTIPYIIHFSCANFLLLNIVGNMIFGMFTNTSIKGRILNCYGNQQWTFCIDCECLRPPRAWHCNTCDICILKRDHHCSFFACCIGYYNHRYFMLFTFYVFISMIYSLYYNIKFLSLFVTWNHGLAIIKFIFPMINFVIDVGEESFYIFLFVINIVVAMASGFLFFYHFNNILNGTIVPERNKDLIYNKGWKLNIIEVFGYRWYLTWISPFVYSPLPGNGIEWNIENKYKDS